jgi:hypothetical protein
MTGRAMKENAQFRRGIALFNAGKYFKSHEVWEELWLAASGDEKTFLQGLIQVAAAFHHHGRGNTRGMKSLLAAGLAKLGGIADGHRGIAVEKLCVDARDWAERDAGHGRLPRIRSVRVTGAKAKRGVS